MKRLNNIFSQICSLENLQLADSNARKGKLNQYGVKMHDKCQQENIAALREMLINKTYKTSPYSKFKIFEPKEREVYRLPFYPDRILHHAIMNLLEPIFTANFTADTFSCIKGRGIHGAANAAKRALLDTTGTQYCLKLDIRKFYPSVDHQVLKQFIRRKFKDRDLLWLLDEIIDSAPGLPIGNYLSQYLANYYLSGFDHWLKQEKRVRYYFRYLDDIVILGHDKADLHQLLAEIKDYLQEELKLQVKSNYQVFPVSSRGIDFVGYVFYHGYTRLRKTIKKNFARMMATRKNNASIASYRGWTLHCNSNHLLKKLLLYETIQPAGRKSAAQKLTG